MLSGCKGLYTEFLFVPSVFFSNELAIPQRPPETFLRSERAGHRDLHMSDPYHSYALSFYV